MRLQLAVLSLRRHVSRTLLAMLGVTVSAAMLLDMVMLATGMRESFASLLGRNGFTIRVSPRGTLPFDSEATIARAADAASVMQRVAGVTAVAPVLGATIHVLRNDERVTAFALGIDPAVQGDYELTAGANPTAADALVASDALLGAIGATIGDTIDVAVGFDPQLATYAGRQRLVIVGRARFLFLSTDDKAAAMQLGTVQAMSGTGRRDRASLFMVRTASGVDAEAARAAIERALPRVTALSTAGAVAEAEKRLSYFRQLAFILGAVSLGVGFLLVTTIVTVSVNERIGEIAIMRAIGVSRAHIVQQIVIEGVGLSLAGALAGLVLGLVTARYLNSILSGFPGLPEAIDFFLFQPSAAFRALGLLVASGIAAGIYPSWRAASLPISSTLREEAVGVTPPQLISARDVHRDYALAGSAVHAVRGVSLDIARGEYLAVVGPSGCGKSTLLNLLGAIDRPTRGVVTVDGTAVSSLPDREATRFRLRSVGFVFQRFYLLPVLTARENVELPMAEAKVPVAERRTRAKELLGYVGLAERGEHRPAELSGGEQQRVAIARALANRPTVLLADEPTGELDAQTGSDVIALFDRLNHEGMTIVVVTHDEKLAGAARRVVHMLDGRVVRDEPLLRRA